MNEQYAKWLGFADIDPATKKELALIKDNESEIALRFSAPMQFGTAGLRAIMGAGISRMNVYTVAQTTKALANLIINERGSEKGVAIAYDSRNNSELFARTAAQVLAAAGIRVYLFESIRPTPELSFTILYKHCIAGINITASHNPKEYNGYKVYWEDGAQLPPEHAAVVSAESVITDIFSVEKADFDSAVSNGSIEVIGAEVDNAFLDAVLNCCINKTVVSQFGNSLNLVYTPLHGTGYRLVPEILKRAGMEKLFIVEEQAIPDGNFPTVDSPNPENKPCFKMAFELIKKHALSTDIVIATDPDGDRLGVAVKKPDGEFIALSGNQIGAVLIDYIIKARKLTSSLPADACAIRSVVSSSLFDRICVDNGVAPIVVLTGFKYIGEKIKQFTADKSHTFIFGYEESQGFLSDGYARDKDAVAASLLITEAASYYKSLGKTVYDALLDIYSKYGYYDEKILNIKIDGIFPMEEMNKKLDKLRNSTPENICGTSVVRVRDYKTGKITSMSDEDEKETGLPYSNMLYYELSDGTHFIIRPSGTEPKIKIYILVNSSSQEETRAMLHKYSTFTI